MIIFKGDFIKLKNNLHGNNDDWLEVEDVEVYDILLLSNGARVAALDLYIADVKSANEYIAFAEATYT